jgi:DNA-binding GntR family transcriptional regulator
MSCLTVTHKWQNGKSHFELMKRRAHDVLTQFEVDRHLRTPLHAQLYRSLRRAIRYGRLPAGSRLPSSRVLAERIGVSRNTVLNAYESLHADGLLIGKVGAGTRVAENVAARSRRFTDLDGNPLQITG